MTFPTDAATITVRKFFGICGPAIVVPSYFLGFTFEAHRFAAHGASRRAIVNAVEANCLRDCLNTKVEAERPAFVIPRAKRIGKAMGGRKAASLRGRRKQRRLGQHEAALQRERLLTEIQTLSEQAGFTHKAGVLLGTAWFQATRSGKQDILRAVNWILRLERNGLHRGVSNVVQAILAPGWSRTGKVPARVCRRPHRHCPASRGCLLLALLGHYDVIR